ncbi:MAG TPA: ribosomal RNA small subunit methyltransferase A [Bacteroidaceae bacterium]|nr:ribosomal RNA small subunit methyltransferase A [Bacteroidaceae bacterium]
MVRPKKRLGQHFLTDPSIAERIVSALDAGPENVVVEIGPGKGILTQFLIEKNIQLVLVEIDPEAVEFLIRKWPGLSENLIQGDILKLSWDNFPPGGIKIIGNFPYNISSQIFFRILENRNTIDTVVCMVQKEVATRLASPPGNRDYGILSVLLQAFFDVTYLFSVKPGSFFPPPGVQSGVIRLTRNETTHLGCDEKLFFEVVRQSFNQRRKTIRNSLKSKLLNLDPGNSLLTMRPEQLGFSEFIELTNMIQAAGNSG